jgi:CheY-like chemotaxis protein
MSDAHVALIVEDDPQIVRLLTQHLDSIGHAHRVASTVAEAVALIADEAFCYGLFDMQIPSVAGAPPLVTGGKTVFERFRKANPRCTAAGHHHVPALVLTSFSSAPDFVSEMYDGGANGFIAKPFGERMEFVLDKIKAALKRGGHEDHEACIRTRKESAPAPVRTPLGKLAKLPTLERWSDLHMHVVDEFTVMIRIGRTHVRRTAIDFGEADTESRVASMQWQLLIDILKAEGAWSHRGYGGRGTLKTKLSRLRKTLKKVFARDDDPFHPYSMAWRPRFWAHREIPQHDGLDVEDGGDRKKWAK